MEKKKLADTYNKRVVCNMPEYEYGELIASLKYENLPHPARLVRFFLDSYLAGDEDARKIVENFKQKNKIAGRGKKDLINKDIALAKNTEALYTLNEEEIDDICDLLDETLPD